jgi:hypothetical protein
MTDARGEGDMPVGVFGIAQVPATTNGTDSHPATIPIVAWLKADGNHSAESGGPIVRPQAPRGLGGLPRQPVGLRDRRLACGKILWQRQKGDSERVRMPAASVSPPGSPRPG